MRGYIIACSSYELVLPVRSAQALTYGLGLGWQSTNAARELLSRQRDNRGDPQDVEALWDIATRVERARRPGGAEKRLAERRRRDVADRSGSNGVPASSREQGVAAASASARSTH
ncbi:hypothetical protein C8Q70DRAFT_951943 [Cubamyces menziesii]|nr:hypothetical protein C8Q70DRAFT_951943 [Cubamyces menziesii]